MTRARDVANIDGLLTTTGDTYYASAASTPARLGVGSTGQVLTVSGGLPTWATPSSGGMTLLSTTSLSGATTTISSINQTYIDLNIFIANVNHSTSNGSFECAPNGSDTMTDSMYFESETAWNYSRAGRILLFKGSTENYSMDRTQALSSLYLTIPNYASANTKSYSCAGGAMTVQTYPSGRGFMSSGFMRTYDPITSLVFRNTGGNLANGTVLVYGVK
jgi:hypothetical protein